MSKASFVRYRVLWAILSAFLLPGFLFAPLSLIAIPDLLNTGRFPLGFSDVIAFSVTTSFFGASIGAPVIILSLFVWKALYRFRLVRPWTFALVGLALGMATGLLFAAFDQPQAWGYVAVFSADGFLTGLIVWLIAYARHDAARERPNISPDQTAAS